MPDNVSRVDCRRRHNRIWQVCTSLSGVFILAVSWAVVAGYGAQQKVEVHSATAREQNKAINEKLDDMRSMQSRILDELFKSNGKK